VTTRSKVDVVVVGAGAAGIGAGKTLAERGVSFAVVEASHRVGGRAYTEDMAPGEPFDLGCHWLHSASINPMREIAERYGYAYLKEDWGQEMHLDGAWITNTEQQELHDHKNFVIKTMCEVADSGKESSIYDCMDRDNRWASSLDYWFSLETSADTDQVSILDLVEYNDTDENWPVRDGYGALIAEFGADVPVELNCAVEAVQWDANGIRLRTVKGTLEANAAIVTVSNGVLGANDIEFSPTLPDWKLDAIANVPLGNHNRICLQFEGDPFGDVPKGGFTYAESGGDNLSLLIHPFGFNQVIGVTGGRFATWLERAGEDASVDYVLECLAKVLGNNVKNHLVKHKVTAWGGDRWIKGAYSAALPGQHSQRKLLRVALDDRLFFAGEATSEASWATAHGAYLSGIRAAKDAVESLA
jgi:monoamine oxidase